MRIERISNGFLVHYYPDRTNRMFTTEMHWFCPDWAHVIAFVAANQKSCS